MKDHIKEIVEQKLGNLEMGVSDSLFNKIQTKRSKWVVWYHIFKYRLHGFYVLSALLISAVGLSLLPTSEVNKSNLSSLAIEEKVDASQNSIQPSPSPQKVNQDPHLKDSNIEKTLSDSKVLTKKPAITSNDKSIDHSKGEKPFESSGDQLFVEQDGIGQSPEHIFYGVKIPKGYIQKYPILPDYESIKDLNSGNSWLKIPGLSGVDGSLEPDLPSYNKSPVIPRFALEIGGGLSASQFVFSGLDNREVDARKNAEQMGFGTGVFLKFNRIVNDRLWWNVGVNYSHFEQRNRQELTQKLTVLNVKEREVTIVNPPYPNETIIVKDTLYIETEETSQSKSSYQFDVIQFPVGVKFFKNLPKMKMSYGGYVAPGLITKRSGTVLNTMNEDISVSSGPLDTKSIFSAGANIALYMPLRKQWMYYIEPQFSYTVTNMSTTNYPLTTQQTQIGLNFGLIYSW